MTQEQTQQARETWKSSADALSTAIGDLRGQVIPDDFEIKGEEVIESKLLLNLEGAIDAYLEKSAELGEFLTEEANAVRSTPKEGETIFSISETATTYEPDEALLAVSAADLALAQALAETLLPEAFAAVQDENLESVWVYAGPRVASDYPQPLETQIYEADQAIRGQASFGAAAPALATGNDFVRQSVDDLIEGSAKSLSASIAKVGVPYIAGEIFEAAISAIPEGWGQALAAATGRLGRLKDKLVALIKTGLDKLSSWLGSRGAEIVNEGRQWLEGKWDDLKTSGIATALLAQILQSRKVTSDGNDLIANADVNQIERAEESLQELLKRQEKRLKFISRISTGIAVASTLSFIPSGAQIYIVAAVAVVASGTTWMCGDALDSPSVRHLPQFIDGIGHRLQIAMN